MITRRAFLRACLLVSGAGVLGACSRSVASNPTPAVVPTTAPVPSPAPAATIAPAVAPTVASAPTTIPTVPTQPAPPTSAPVEAIVAPTPACGDDDDDPTLAQTEGPYYTPNTPERVSLLEPGMAGTRLIISGVVMTTACQPLARALLDFWQADDAGVYDNAGFRLRGHQFTDEQGRYRLETILPGLYPGRTRHIHVKVQAPNQPVLTTQLYFAGETANERDRIFHPALAMPVQDANDGKAGIFDFVLETR